MCTLVAAFSSSNRFNVSLPTRQLPIICIVVNLEKAISNNCTTWHFLWPAAFYCSVVGFYHDGCQERGCMGKKAELRLTLHLCRRSCSIRQGSRWDFSWNHKFCGLFARRRPAVVALQPLTAVRLKLSGAPWCQLRVNLRRRVRAEGPRLQRPSLVCVWKGFDKIS